MSENPAVPQPIGAESGLALGAQGRERPSRRDSRACFRRMLALVWPHRRRMALGVLLGLGVAATYAASLGGMLPLLKVVIEQDNLRAWLLERAAHQAGWRAATLTQAAQWFPDAAAPHARMHTLLILVAILLAVNLLGNLCRTLSQYYVLYASNRVVMDLRRMMYRKALHVPLNDLSGDVSIRVSQFMSDVREVFLGIGTFFGKFAREPLKAACVLAVALAVDWRLTLAVLGIGPIAVAAFWHFGRKVRKATMRLLEGYGVMLAGLEESLQGVEVVKSHTRELHERRRMWSLERRMMKQQLKLAWIEALASPLMEVLGVLAAAGAMVWLAAQMFADPPRMDPSHFITMVILLAALLDPVRKVANIYNMIQRAGAAATRIFAFLDQPEERSPRHPRRLPEAPARAVRFEGVRFAYTPDQSPPALDGVSLEVAPGACLAIVGPNGSGKSTLMKLLPRLFDPAEGRVTIDGIDVRELSLRDLREQIAVVTQRPVIFARTVRENIAYGAEHAGDEQVREAARRAYAADFIERWPQGYETVLGEFGSSISGGQRQRIAIARAFLKRSSILIFDEATSEIDAESERKIHDALGELRKGRTTFLIAHRHTVMDLADRIVVMDGGRIIDTGAHADLLARCPLYAALYSSPPP